MFNIFAYIRLKLKRHRRSLPHLKQIDFFFLLSHRNVDAHISPHIFTGHLCSNSTAKLQYCWLLSNVKTTKTKWNWNSKHQKHCFIVVVVWFSLNYLSTNIIPKWNKWANNNKTEVIMEMFVSQILVVRE